MIGRQIKNITKKFARSFGYDIVPASMGDGALPPDLTENEKQIWEKVRPYTMTGIERVTALIQATAYLVENRIEGDIVECGVWRGGSSMAIAETLLRLGDTRRTLYLYDTFEGMTEPTETDLQFDGQQARDLLEQNEKNTGIWCYAELDEVKKNLDSTGYPADNVRYIQGRVEETLPEAAPATIALLRLDTDWYESTRHELIHLFPRLVSGGVLLIDDYGHWQGSKRATDEFLRREYNARPFLHRIDYSGRLLIKP